MIKLNEVENAKALVDMILNRYLAESMDDDTYASMKDFLSGYLKNNPASFNDKKVLMLLPVYDCPDNAVEIVAVTHNDSHLVGQIRRTINYNDV